ncbi:MAG: hypothetical protein O7D86_04950 [Proteobacteria bacterium]|nr:hypothetical protein [Pseudomonadota bacterium]
MDENGRAKDIAFPSIMGINKTQMKNGANLMKTLDQVTVEDIESSSLLDCYRIALDFGMPAALKAYEKLTLEATNKDTNTKQTPLTDISNP